jgi:ParB family chromosome partitioning protein
VPQRARAPQAALDLVEDERRAGLVAALASGHEQVVVQHPHAALALHGLQEDRGGALVDRGAQRVGARRHGPEAGDERGERGLLGLLRRGAQRAVRAPVEGAVDRDDVAALAGLAGALDRGLDRLGAAVGEEDAPAERPRAEPLGQAGHRLGVEEVADVEQPARLLAHGGDDGRVAVPDARHADAGEEVEVLVAVRVPQPRALAAVERDRVPRVRRHERRAVDRRAHARPGSSCRCPRR